VGQDRAAAGSPQGGDTSETGGDGDTALGYGVGEPYTLCRRSAPDRLTHWLQNACGRQKLGSLGVGWSEGDAAHRPKGWSWGIWHLRSRVRYQEFLGGAAAGDGAGRAKDDAEGSEENDAIRAAPGLSVTSCRRCGQPFQPKRSTAAFCSGR
jgi:hypothetical protein